jgi:sortase A
MPLVDLQIGVQLEFLVNGSTTPSTSAQPGDTVKFRITLTNLGASRLGCTDIEAPVGTEPCHLNVVSNQANLNTLLGLLAGSIARTVLNPAGQTGASATFETDVYDVVGTDVTTTYTLTADRGGYYTAALASANRLQYYILAAAVDSETLTIERPHITVSIVVQPNPSTFGQPIQYTVTVLNDGSMPVSNLRALYQISPLAAVPANNNGIMLVGDPLRPALQTSGTLTLNPTTLQPGQSAVGILAKGAEDQTRTYAFIVIVTGDGVATGDVVATADVNVTPLLVGTATPTPSGSLTPTVDPSTLDPNAIEPQVTKTADVTAAQPGGAITWTVTVRNGGTGTFTNVTLKDAVPDTMTIVSSSVSRGVAVTDGQLITVTTGQMAPGDTITLTISTTVSSTVTSPATITNTACANRDGGSQVCATGTVSIGPDAGALPATGMSALPGARGFPLGWLLGIGLMGALMILMSAQVSDRRVLIAAIFLLVSLAAVVAAVTLLLLGGEESKPPAEVGPAAPSSTPVAPAPAGQTPAAPGETVQAPQVLVPPTPSPYIVPTPAGVRLLMIPKLADQFQAPIPIVELPLVNRQWDVSGLGYYVGWLQGTTWMDPQWGNTVLAAHVQLGFHNPGPFWGLGTLEPGDTIVITEGDTQREFLVTTVKKVDPGDWTVTAPTNEPILTLLTCTEWDQAYGVFAQRMVVQAVPAG